MYWLLDAADFESHKQPVRSVAGNGFQESRALRRLPYLWRVLVGFTAKGGRQG